MKILAISDQTDPKLYERFDKSFFKGVDLVISCGDLPRYYLDFIIDALDVPCFYVHGNHDRRIGASPPPGWVCLDGKIVRHGNLSIMGLGGSKKYNMESPFQFSEWEMRVRYWKLLPGLMLNRGIDVFVSHSPSFLLGDLPESPVHSGFKVFRRVLEKHSPRVHLYGHAHPNYGVPWSVAHNSVPCLNSFRYRIVEVEPRRSSEG